MIDTEESTGLDWMFGIFTYPFIEGEQEDYEVEHEKERESVGLVYKDPAHPSNEPIQATSYSFSNLGGFLCCESRRGPENTRLTPLSINTHTEPRVNMQPVAARIRGTYIDLRKKDDDDDNDEVTKGLASSNSRLELAKGPDRYQHQVVPPSPRNHSAPAY